jgi:hypothetical protein
VTAMLWRDKHGTYILINMHITPTNCNFYEDFGNAIKPSIIQDKKLFFHLLGMKILNSFLLLTSCDARMTHR